MHHPHRQARRALLKTAVACSLAAAAPWAAAQAWPARPIRVVVGFAPGGTTDVLARIVAQALTEALGQTAIVDNKPGVSGNLAAGDVIKAAPDGYTLLVAPTSVETANPSLFKAAFHPSKDLTPVAAIGMSSMYVVAGQADYVFDSGIAFPHIRAGKVKLLGVAGNKRSPFFPEVPTLAEQGVNGAAMDIWFGVWAPNGIPAEVVARVHKELSLALAKPAIRQRMGDLGAEPAPLEQAAFRRPLADEGRVLTALIKDRKISVE